MATTVFNPVSSQLDTCPPKYGKCSVTDEVLRTMGIPPVIVEMAHVLHLQRQKHGMDTKVSAEQLFNLAEELINNPRKQYEIGQQMHKSEPTAVVEVPEEKMKMKTHKDLYAEEVQEHGAIVKGKAALGNSAEMQDKALSKADARPAADDKSQLKEKVQRLARENHRLRQRKMCRKCKEVDLATSGVTFLPCGHFITCESCSEAYEDCPACGKSIMGTVRTSCPEPLPPLCYCGWCSSVPVVSRSLLRAGTQLVPGSSALLSRVAGDGRHAEFFQLSSAGFRHRVQGGGKSSEGRDAGY